MRTSTSVLAVGILSAAMLLGACGYGSLENPVPVSTSAAPTVTATATVTATETVPPVTATATTTATATATTTTTETPPSTPAQPPPSATSAPAPAPAPSFVSDADIRAETDSAFETANRYWTNILVGWKAPAWVSPVRFNGDGFYDSAIGWVAPCHNDRRMVRNAFFCPSGNGTGYVAWDLQLFREDGRQFGDAAYYVIVAHELGHAAQARFDADHQEPAVYRGVMHELQADCLAGATLAKAVQDGYLQTDDGDLDEATHLMLSMEDDGTHGTPEQRVKWFFIGHDSADIEACLGQRGQPQPAP